MILSYHTDTLKKSQMSFTFFMFKNVNIIVAKIKFLMVWKLMVCVCEYSVCY